LNHEHNPFEMAMVCIRDSKSAWLLSAALSFLRHACDVVQPPHPIFSAMHVNPTLADVLPELLRMRFPVPKVYERFLHHEIIGETCSLVSAMCMHPLSESVSRFIQSNTVELMMTILDKFVAQQMPPRQRVMEQNFGLVLLQISNALADLFFLARRQIYARLNRSPYETAPARRHCLTLAQVLYYRTGDIHRDESEKAQKDRWMVTGNILQVLEYIFRPRIPTDFPPGPLTREQELDFSENRTEAAKWGLKVLHEFCKKDMLPLDEFAELPSDRQRPITFSNLLDRVCKSSQRLIYAIQHDPRTQKEKASVYQEMQQSSLQARKVAESLNQLISKAEDKKRKSQPVLARQVDEEQDPVDDELDSPDDTYPDEDGSDRQGYAEFSNDDQDGDQKDEDAYDNQQPYENGSQDRYDPQPNVDYDLDRVEVPSGDDIG